MSYTSRSSTHPSHSSTSSLTSAETKKLARQRSVWALVSLGTLALASACGGGADVYEDVGQVRQAATETPEPILVNQLGYAPGATKIAVMLGATGTPATGDKVEVLTSTGTVAAGGTFDHTKITAKAADNMSGDAVHHVDFSGFTTAGTGYKVRVTMAGVARTSGSFNISTTPYKDGTKQLALGAFKMINWKRSGAAVAANTEYNIAGHAAAHTGDSAMSVYAGSLPMPTGPVDVAGGWYDAGDNGKYLESHTAATFFLANTFERMKGMQDPAGTSIDTLSLGITDSALPDVLDEIAWGTRWVMGTLPKRTLHVTNPTRIDLVMNKCTSNSWPAYPIAYESDTTARSCMGPSTSATYSAVRAMAHVSRLLRPYTTTTTSVKPVGAWSGSTYYTAGQYSDELWNLAKEAFGRASGKFPGAANYTGAGASGNARFTTDLNLASGAESPGFNKGSGGYADEDMADDEYSAAVELYLTACARGDSVAVGTYKPLVTGHMYYKQAGWCDWGSESALGDPDGEEVGCGTLSLITAHDAVCTGTNALPAADITQMKSNHVAFANSLITIIEGQNYPAHAATGIGLKWGSNGAQAGAAALLAAAYQISLDKKYLRTAARAMDYILGVNPRKVSYVIGFGPNAAQHSHDRAMGAANKFVAGTLVGGPLGINGGGWPGTDNLLDDLAARFPGGDNINDTATPKTGAPLKRYAHTDNGSASWESKENAINWEASLAAAAWSLQVFSKDMTGTTTCQAETCTTLGAACGTIPDNGCGTPLNCGTCSSGQTCNTSNQCVTTSTGLANGSSCTGGSQCTSGNCVDGVCCNTTCGGGAATDCQVCNKTGSVGTCSPSASGTSCRASAGDCDVAESCNGSATTCPTDAKKASGTVCRTSTGTCDVSETCSGTANTCPTNGYAANGTTCDDANASTTNDVCTSGSCAGTTSSSSGPCASPVTLTGSGSYSVNSTGTCFQVSVAANRNGVMATVMNTSNNASTTIEWYGGTSESTTACVQSTRDLSGNGAQLNNFTVGKDTVKSTSGYARFIIKSKNTSTHTVSVSQGVWQNGNGCTAPAPSSGGGSTASCTDATKNGSETDVDCGGSCGTKCANGKLCSVSADCSSANCVSGICQAAASCGDGVKNGNETGVDCGGSCTACASCSDGVKNGNETGVDCGGSCTACASCTDGVRNGSETGVDCGGSCAACVTASCTDGIKNGTETGIDCGGSCAACVTASCTDGVKNGTETGIDCGGSCTACASTEPCTPSATFGAGVTNSGNFGTKGAYCFRTSMTIAGWGCSNFDGRTLQVNDVAQSGACGSMPLPTKFNGYYYFEASAGKFDYASIYWWQQQ